MKIAAFDIGSSSVKFAVLDTDRPGDFDPAAVRRVGLKPFVNGPRVEYLVAQIYKAIYGHGLDFDWRGIDRIGLTGMAPAWLAVNHSGLVDDMIISHQDRRSVLEAQQIEKEVGRERHLQLAGNRPTPGGISSTSARWWYYSPRRDPLMFGHLPTWLLFNTTGQWAMDPSNAGFTGLMDVSTGTWSPELCDAAKVPIHLMPPIVDAADASMCVAERSPIGGIDHNSVEWPVSMPVFGGFVDGSGPILLAGARTGQLVHAAGSTDVLALCLDEPMPREGLLCRPLGTAGKWVSAATQAASGDALKWLHRTLFESMPFEQFADQLSRWAERETDVSFDPSLAGDRQAVLQPTGAWTNLTLAASKDDLAAAVVQGVLASHASRIRRIFRLADEAGIDILPEVITTGGGGPLAELMHATWPSGGWRFREEPEATLRGVGALAAMSA